MATISSQDRARQRATAPSQLREATVLDPPLTDEGWLRVEVDGQEGAVRECPWMPRLDLEPFPGDAAAVMESDDGNWWAVQWWSQSGVDPSPVASGGATWHSGAGAPAAALGDDGDFYLDTLAHSYYGPKMLGAWGDPTPLVGPQGPVGPAGAQGAQGIQGPQGAQGIVGPAGAQGVQGPVGPAGQSFTWRGAWNAATAYHLDDAVMGSDGSSYIALGNTTGNDPVTDGGVHWSLSVIHGAVGPQGPQGAQGPQGIQGVAGPQGAVGPTGYDTSPIGSVITHTSQVIPAEYLLANGQQVNAVDYPQLDTYAQAEVAAGNPNWSRPVVGGVQKVQLPDLRDRFIYGGGAGASKAFGSKAGAESVALAAGDLPPHQHTNPNISVSTSAIGESAGMYHRWGAWDLGVGDATGSNGAYAMGQGPTGNGPGASTPHNNMPPYCVLALLIKAKGVSISSGAIVGPPGPAGKDADIGLILALGG